MTAPAAQDLFSRFLGNSFDERQLIGVPTAGQTFFGNPANGARTEFSPDDVVFEMQIIKGNERISAFTPRGSVSRALGSNQKNVITQRFSEVARVFPLVEEEGDISAVTLLNRIFTEGVSGGRTQMERMREKARDIIAETTRRQVRLFEVLAWQSLLTGEQDAGGGEVYDFRRRATHIATVPTSWAGGSADILGDIDGACTLGRTDGHMTMDIGVFGSTAMDSFIKDTTVQSLADNRRYEFIRLGDNNLAPARYQRFIDAGFTPQGKVRTPQGYEIWLFVYNEFFTDSAGDPQPYIPVDTAFFTSSSARFDRFFGPGEGLPMIPQRQQLYRQLFGFDVSAPPIPGNIKGGSGIIVPAMFHSDAYVSTDWKRITIRQQSAPVFVTTHTDAIVVLDTEP